MGEIISIRTVGGDVQRLRLTDAETQRLREIRRAPHKANITERALEALEHARLMFSADQPVINLARGLFAPGSLFQIRSSPDRDAWGRGYEAGARHATQHAQRELVALQPAGSWRARLSRLLKWSIRS
jgi:hypothetical protein